MIRDRKARALSDLLPRDKLRRMTDAQYGTVRELESRSGENSYKRSSVKPCFKTVFLGMQKSYKRSHSCSGVAGI